MPWYMHLEIDSEGRLRTKPNDKIDDFNFLIENFPFICSSITVAPVYGVYISQFIRYSRACSSYQDFLDRRLLLTRKLLNQGFLLVKLKWSLRMFYGRQHDLNDRYGILVSVTNDQWYVQFVVITTRSFPPSWLYHRFCNKSNKTGARRGVWVAYPSGTSLSSIAVFIIFKPFLYGSMLYLHFSYQIHVL